MFIITILVSIVITYLSINFVAVFYRNQKAFKFFAQKCPNLPTVPNPGIFDGHLSKVLMNDHCWEIIDKYHEKYGPSFGVFFIEQPWVATKDLDLIKLIELDDAKKHPNRAFFGGPMKSFNESTFQLADEDWRGARHVFAPALTNFKVRGNEVSSGVELCVEKFAASLQRKLKNSKQNAVELDIRDASERFALSVIFLVSYRQTDVIDFDAEKDRWAELFAKGAKDASSLLVVVSMEFPFLRNLISFLATFSPIGIWEASIINHIKKYIEEKKKIRKQENGNDTKPSAEASKNGLLDTVIESYIAKKLTYEHTMGSLLQLVLAGGITTADTMSCLIWQLAMNQDVQEKLRKSIEEDGIGSEYLSWCINETIRWHPAVPLGTGRILGEDVTVNGQSLPKGTFVMPSAYTIHHDPNIWPEPEQFKPERWIDQASFHPAAFVGFGLGPRNCFGRYLAVHEIKLMLIMLMSEYRIEVCDRTPREWRFTVPAMLFTVPKEPLIVKYVPLK